MAKYRHTEAENGQGLFLSVNLKEQLIPGTFEHMLDKIIGKEIDTSIFDNKYKNDQTGARAIPPEALLKLILYGYSKGQKSSRNIWELNRNNIVAKALTGDMDIHWTTIADFISGSSKEFEGIFIKVLTYCSELGLIGGETFAIDGLRLPSNASLEMSGTRRQLKKRLEVYRKMAKKHVERHQRRDSLGETNEEVNDRYEKRQKYLAQKMEKISEFLEMKEEKIGKSGKEIQSNVTDNESAMIHSKKGFIQGYIGLAVSDQKNQIIVNAQAVGTANEGEHLPEMLDRNTENLKSAGVKESEEGKKTAILGDANYFSEENLKVCEERGIEAVITDASRFPANPSTEENKRYDGQNFEYNQEEDCYICPQGKKLVYKYKTKLRRGERKLYQASLTDCRICPVYSMCVLTKKKQNELTQGKKIIVEPEGFCNRMREKMKTEEYQAKYAYRIQIVEPVFANMKHCKGLDRFTLRGKEKVNGQWKLYCMVHNLGKCLNALNKRENIA